MLKYEDKLKLRKSCFNFKVYFEQIKNFSISHAKHHQISTHTYSIDKDDFCTVASSGVSFALAIKALALIVLAPALLQVVDHRFRTAS